MNGIRTSILLILCFLGFNGIQSNIFGHSSQSSYNNINVLDTRVNGRMVIGGINSQTISVLLQINTNSGLDAMGGATMVIGFDTSTISYKESPVKNLDYIFHNFCDGKYSLASVTRPMKDKIWINIDLPINHTNDGTIVAGGSDWTDVVTINFVIKNSRSLANVFWITNSVFWGIYDDDNITFWNIGQFQDALNIPLPVELSSFTATITNDKVVLEWWTLTEVDNYGFEIERSVDNYEWQKIGFLRGYGNSNSPKFYSYIDNQLNGGTIFRYRLKQIDTDGSYEFSEMIEVEFIPKNFALYQNYPNPFNPLTKIKYTIPVVIVPSEEQGKQSRFVTLKVYDVLGNEVATLVNEEKSAGTYELEFSTKGGSVSAGTGNDLSSGIYFYKLQAGDFIETKKMILMK